MPGWADGKERSSKRVLWTVKGGELVGMGGKKIHRTRPRSVKDNTLRCKVGGKRKKKRKNVHRGDPLQVKQQHRKKKKIGGECSKKQRFTRARIQGLAIWWSRRERGCGGVIYCFLVMRDSNLIWGRWIKIFTSTSGPNRISKMLKRSKGRGKKGRKKVTFFGGDEVVLD